ncbi:MAG: ABC transporter ATP-binding protein [Halioglobus sp.]
MFNTFKKLFGLLTHRQKRDFYVLQLLMLLTAGAELVGVASIMPFMAVAADPQLIVSNEYLHRVYVLFGEPSDDIFLTYIGGAFILLIFLSNGLLLLSQYLMNNYAHRLGGEFSVSVYNHYLRQNTLFHNRKNSADLIQHIMRDTLRLSTHLVAPALRLNGRAFSIVLLCALIVYVDVFVAINSLFVLLAVYWFVFYVLRSRIYRNGKNVSDYNASRNRLLNESFEGIKDIKLYAAENQLLQRFRGSTREVARALSENMILGQSPYYIVETVVLAGALLVALFLIMQKGDMEAVLPVLALYCMAGFKLVPKVQQSYLAITQIRSAQAPFNSLYEVLKAANREYRPERNDSPALRPRKSISLDKVCFSYPESGKALFDGLTLEIPVGEAVAITGASGAGKSTILEILLGLIEPDTGHLCVDGEPLRGSKLEGWRRSVGFVPQTVYLADASVAENIAFGLPPAEIDQDRVRTVARLAGAAGFVDELAQGYDTLVGERGALISGGQRQRIGIARALYRDVSVLVLDEATSALDNATQEEIFRNLRSAMKEITMVMVTHRAETLRHFDRVYTLSKGTLTEAKPSPD